MRSSVNIERGHKAWGTSGAIVAQRGIRGTQPGGRLDFITGVGGPVTSGPLELARSASIYVEPGPAVVHFWSWHTYRRSIPANHLHLVSCNTLYSVADFFHGTYTPSCNNTISEEAAHCLERNLSAKMHRILEMSACTEAASTAPV